MALTDKLTAIGDAIRGKTGKTEGLTLDQMATEISGIQAGGAIEPLTVTENGTYTAPSGVDGYNPVTVNVAGSAPIEKGVVYVTVNSTVRHAVFYGTEVRNYALKSDQKQI